MWLNSSHTCCVCTPGRPSLQTHHPQVIPVSTRDRRWAELLAPAWLIAWQHRRNSCGDRNSADSYCKSCSNRELHFMWDYVSHPVKSFIFRVEGGWRGMQHTREGVSLSFCMVRCLYFTGGENLVCLHVKVTGTADKYMDHATQCTCHGGSLGASKEA